MTDQHFRPSFWRSLYPPLKRLIDIVGSALVLLMLAPLLVVIWVAIRVSSDGPALFAQERVGRHGAPFVMWKFRTMRVNAPDLRNADGTTFNAADDSRVTRIGRVLRSTSLDEIPQLWNVLAGDMSFVGGRPDLPDGVLRYTGDQVDRLLVRPGMTSWAIVNGRNNVPVDTRRELDAWYARNVSLALDVKILLMTIWVVIGRDGVINDYSKGTAMSGRNAKAPDEAAPTVKLK